MLEVQIEIEEMLVELNNKYCEDYVESIWDEKFLIKPKKDSGGIVETKLAHIYHEYMCLAEKAKAEISEFEGIRDELEEMI
ncbi:MAG: hypothetical protein E7311_01555 [Clostridiales bacterium]|nr:hypothetical protein [Clostridiales bacterium]